MRKAYLAHTKPKGTLGLNLTKAKQTISFKTVISIEGTWKIGLTSQKVHISIFNKTENNKFESFTDNFDKFSFTELKDELEEILGAANSSNERQ